MSSGLFLLSNFSVFAVFKALTVFKAKGNDSNDRKKEGLRVAEVDVGVALEDGTCPDDGLADGEEAGVFAAFGEELGDGVDAGGGEEDGDGEAEGVGVGEVLAVGLGVLDGVGEGVLDGVGVGVSEGVGEGVPEGVGEGVRDGEGVGVTEGV